MCRPGILIACSKQTLLTTPGSGGVPVGALVGSSELGPSSSGKDYSTFGVIVGSGKLLAAERAPHQVDGIPITVEDLSRVGVQVHCPALG